MYKQLFLYILRWQLSTPILALITYLTIDNIGSFNSAVLANFIGSLIFFNVDKLIFKK